MYVIKYVNRLSGWQSSTPKGGNNRRNGMGSSITQWVIVFELLNVAQIKCDAALLSCDGKDWKTQHRSILITLISVHDLSIIYYIISPLDISTIAAQSR